MALDKAASLETSFSGDVYEEKREREREGGRPGKSCHSPSAMHEEKLSLSEPCCMSCFHNGLGFSYTRFFLRLWNSLETETLRWYSLESQASGA